jgi:hypothetical protein
MQETRSGALRALFRETALPAQTPAARASKALAGLAAARAQAALHTSNSVG